MLFLIVAKQHNGMSAKMALRIQAEIGKKRHIHINQNGFAGINHLLCCLKYSLIILTGPTVNGNL